ncbi:MAG: hypothetical protein E4H36_07080 [Spirochaetales bacterium]|nr:MAG: hypothetical protein E4H36_07080 [Spirochaetales bacterium]
MKERIKRVKILFKELGYRVYDGDQSEDTYSAGIDDKQGFQSGFFIDNDSRFLELAFTFSFSIKLGAFIQQKLEDLLKICYEYGCYLNIFKNRDEIAVSVFSKLYFAGLNYYALRNTLEDFRLCIEALKELFDIKST